MSRASSALKRLERQTARQSPINGYAVQEQERLDAMADGQLLRELARLCHQWIDGPPEGPAAQNYAIADVDAMIDAGDLDGAWAFLDRQIATFGIAL